METLLLEEKPISALTVNELLEIAKKVKPYQGTLELKNDKLELKSIWIYDNSAIIVYKREYYNTRTESLLFLAKQQRIQFTKEEDQIFINKLLEYEIYLKHFYLINDSEQLTKLRYYNNYYGNSHTWPAIYIKIKKMDLKLEKFELDEDDFLATAFPNTIIYETYEGEWVEKNWRPPDNIPASFVYNFIKLEDKVRKSKENLSNDEQIQRSIVPNLQTRK